MVPDLEWSGRTVRVSFDVKLAEHVKAQTFRGNTYFVDALYITITWYAEHDEETVSYKGRAFRAKTDGTPSKRVMEFNQYTFVTEAEEVGAIVEEAKRRARRHWS